MYIMIYYSQKMDDSTKRILEDLQKLRRIKRWYPKVGPQWEYLPNRSSEGSALVSRK